MRGHRSLIKSWGSPLRCRCNPVPVLGVSPTGTYIILSYSDMCMFAYNKIKGSVKFIVNKNSHPIKVSLDCFKNVKTVNFNDFPIRCKDVYSGLWIINPISLISRFGFISNHWFDNQTGIRICTRGAFWSDGKIDIPNWLTVNPHNDSCRSTANISAKNYQSTFASLQDLVLTKLQGSRVWVFESLWRRIRNSSYFPYFACYFTWSWSRDGWSSDRWLSVELFPSSELSWIRITSWRACCLWARRYSEAGFSPSPAWIHLRPSFYGGDVVQKSPWRSESLTWRCWRCPPPPWEFRTGRRRPSPCGNGLCCWEPSQPVSTKQPHSGPARPTWFSMRSLVSWSVLVWLVLAGSVLLFSLSRSLISRGPSRRDWHRRVTPFSSEDPETEMFVVGVREVRGVLGPTWAVVYTGCSPRVEFPVLAQLVSHVGSTASTSIPSSSSSSSSPGSSQLQSFLSPFTNIPGKNKHLQLSEMQI